MYADWSYPTKIRFGSGRVSELPDACTAAGIRHPLLVTDKGLAGLPLTSRVLDILEDGGLGRASFTEVDPNPSDENLVAGLKVYREQGCDGVVAFGGGSGIDLGKMIAFMSGQSRPIWDFEDIGDYWTRANHDSIAPIVAVPTTAGTGSEVGRASVITNSSTRTKKIIFHPKVLPALVIADPELTVGMPSHVTAGTGMDAFAHCLEAYCSPHYHPMSQGIALEGMKLVKDSLVTAFRNPDDLEARANMMSAASMGAVAFQKGLGAIHAISHPVGALFDTHHGTTNAVVMPMVLSFNRHAVTDGIERAASYLGISGGFDGFAECVVDLREELGIPRNLAELGASVDQIPKLTEMALADPCTGGNPVAMTVDNTRSLYEACF